MTTWLFGKSQNQDEKWQSLQLSSQKLLLKKFEKAKKKREIDMTLLLPQFVETTKTIINEKIKSNPWANSFEVTLLEVLENYSISRQFLSSCGDFSLPKVAPDEMEWYGKTPSEHEKELFLGALEKEFENVESAVEIDKYREKVVIYITPVVEDEDTPVVDDEDTPVVVDEDTPVVEDEAPIPSPSPRTPIPSPRTPIPSPTLSPRTPSSPRTRRH